MAETAVTILIELLWPLLIEEVKLIKGAKKGVATIQQELEMIRAFLRDADKRQLRDEAVKVWVKQVREEAYDIEDSVDKFIYQMWRPDRHAAFFFFRQQLARRQIASKVQDYQSRLKNISERAKSFGLRIPGSGGDGQSSHRGARLTSLFIEESQVVGIEKPREDLIRQLLVQESKPLVISVTGMAGVGKSTLVRKVCEDKEVKKQFECRAWVTVSKTFRLRKILKTMIKQLKMREQQLIAHEEKKLMVAGEDEARLVETMRKYLQKKRYLIVLDDVWTENDWESIKCAFPENGFQSNIIVTTRNTKVASYCSNSDEYVHKLEPMPKEEAWTLFCKKAFGAETGDGCPLDLEGTSRSMVEVCGGLPLAIVAIGGVLSTKTKTLPEWERVNRCLKSELEANQSLEPMKEILWLSYDDLPYHLKPCFLYFGMLPVDSSIKRSKITRLWIAEGFVTPISNKSFEEIAEGYLNELVQRNLVQALKFDCFGRVHRCRIHDIMYELVLQKCREQNFHVTWSQDSSRMDEKIRRLVVFNTGNILLDSPNLFHLRSLLLLASNEVPLSPRFRNLKVLHLKKVPLQSFPSEILNLFHLKYLHLRKTNIKELPKSIWKLQNLLTLDLKRTPISVLPREIVKLKNLRHLLVYEQMYLGVEIPEKMGNLTTLQKLAHVNITGGNDQLAELSNLTQLKRLCITKLEPGDGEALCNSIRNMSQLESLYLYPGHDDKLLEVESLPLASPFLRSINLRGQLPRLPDSICSFKSLEKLRLNFSKLRDDPFYILQHLPSLVELNLHNDSYDGEEMRTRNGGFLKLRKLHIHNFTKLCFLLIEQGAMPNLDYLEFLYCEKLERVPSGIEHLKNLKELYLGLVSEECMNKVKRDEGEDWAKVMHIPLIRKIYRENGQLYHMDL